MKTKIIDNCFSEEELNAIIHGLFNRNWFFIDDYSKKNYKKSYYKTKTLAVTKENYIEFDHFDYFFIEKLNNILGTRLNPQKMRILINCFKYGDKPTYHTDNRIGAPTFLFFVNPEWMWWWGSCLKIKNKFYTQSIKPKPGRLVIFDGSKKHCGVPPNLLYRGCGRFSFVIQYQQSLDFFLN
jgi:Rps23 Pro-64 3,4-dihydroxylase Tpa1-like proline 4-hydroxylase